MREADRTNPLEIRIHTTATQIQKMVDKDYKLKDATSETKTHMVAGISPAWTATTLQDLGGLINATLHMHAQDLTNTNARGIMHAEPVLSSRINPEAAQARAYEVQVGTDLVSQLRELTTLDPVPFSKAQVRAAALMTQLQLAINGVTYVAGQAGKDRKKVFDEGRKILNDHSTWLLRRLQREQVRRHPDQAEKFYPLHQTSAEKTDGVLDDIYQALEDNEIVKQQPVFAGTANPD
jgi:hypothetical protein